MLARMPGLYQSIIRMKNRKEYDNERIAFMSAVRDGDVVCDIGANRGIHTILFSHLVGKNGEVHAFEPVPPTFKMLSDNLAGKKRFDNIRLNNSAVGDKKGTVTINMPGGDDGQASMAKHEAGSWKGVNDIRTYDCAVTTLSDYAAESMKRPPNFIKCDVEGAEMLAMLGAKDVLKAHTPILFLEICKNWTRDFGYTPLELLQYVKQFGYDRFYIVDDHIRESKNIEEDLKENNLGESIDLLCAISSRHADRLTGLY